MRWIVILGLPFRLVGLLLIKIGEILLSIGMGKGIRGYRVIFP